MNPEALHGASPVHPGGSGKRFSLLDLLHVVARRWKTGMFVGLIAAVCLATFLMTRPPRYEAVAKLLVETNTGKVVDVQEVVETEVRNSNMLIAAMNTHVERLRSRSMAQSVVDSLTDSERERLLETLAGPRENRAPGAPEPDAAAYLANQALTLKWLPQSMVIRIQVSSPDGKLAQILANQYARTYQVSQAKARRAATHDAVNFLDDQTAELKERIETGERELQGYRSKHNLLSIEENQDIIAGKLSQLSAAVTAARVRLFRADAQMDQVTRAGDDIESLVSIPFIGPDSNVRSRYNRLEELRTERAILEKDLLARHPRILANTAARAAVEAELLNAIENARQELVIEQKTISEEVSRLEEALAAAKAEALNLDRIAIDYRVLARNLDAARLTYDQLARRLNETALSQDLPLTTIKVLDEARAPRKPAWPDPTKVGLASGLLFGMFLISLPLGLEFSDQRLRSFLDIETDLGRPVLGDVLFRRGKRPPDLAAAVIRQDDRLSESFQVIYSSLKLQFGKLHRPRTLIVTSSLPLEGKTFVASNLAETFSCHGKKTVLLDCDWRRPSVHRYHGLSNAAGILPWLRSGEHLSADLLADPLLGLTLREGTKQFYILPSGGATSQAAELLDQPRLALLISRLQQEFEIILVDTPPVGLFPDATLLAEHADHTIFVARQNKVSRQKARSAIARMAQTGAPVTGVVFNAVKNMRLASGYGNQAGAYQSSDYRRYRRSYKPPKTQAAAPLTPQLESP